MLRRLLGVVLAASLLASSFAAAQVQIRIRSDFEAGTRAYQAGDLKMAIIFFRQGVEKGERESEYALGTHHAFGDGVEEDFPKALSLLESSASKGYAPAMTFLGVMHQRGRGVPIDHGKAAQLFRRASLLCDPDGQNLLAGAYLGGLGVPEDRAEAHAWLRLAAEGGVEQARKSVEPIGGLLTAEEREKSAALYAENKRKVECPAGR